MLSDPSVVCLVLQVRAKQPTLNVLVDLTDELDLFC